MLVHHYSCRQFSDGVARQYYHRLFSDIFKIQRDIGRKIHYNDFAENGFTLHRYKLWMKYAKFISLIKQIIYIKVLSSRYRYISLFCIILPLIYILFLKKRVQCHSLRSLKCIIYIYFSMN